MIKAVIFDFDGLILDTEISAYQSWQEIYRTYQCDLDLDQWVRCIGGTYEHFDPCVHLEQLLGSPIPREEVLKRRLARHLEIIEGQLALPGVEDYLRDAHRLGLKVALASNSPRSWVGGHLSRLGLLDYFQHIKTGDQVQRAKPSPDLYLAALADLEVSSTEAIALEDSPHGVRAAQSAGIFCVAIPNQLTGRLPLDHADLRLPSMAALSLEALLAHVQKKRHTSSVS